MPRKKPCIKYCLSLSLRPFPSHFPFLAGPPTALTGSSLTLYKHLLPFIYARPLQSIPCTHSTHRSRSGPSKRQITARQPLAANLKPFCCSGDKAVLSSQSHHHPLSHQAPGITNTVSQKRWVSFHPSSSGPS